MLDRTAVTAGSPTPPTPGVRAGHVAAAIAVLIVVGSAFYRSETTWSERHPHCHAGPDTRMAIRVTCTPSDGCALAKQLAVDVWSEHTGPSLPLDVVVWRHQLGQLDRAGVPYDILSRDIDADAEAEAARIASHARVQKSGRVDGKSGGNDVGDWFAEYHDYRETTARLNELAELAPDRASVHAIGTSIDNRPIWALRIGHGTGTRMLIDGTLHAREWIATAVTTCVADRLVRDYDRDPAIQKLVDSTDLWVVPVVNPDGYQYSWSTNRYWRKNRRGSHGVDLNRNFGVAWGGSGSSKSPRSEVYRGEYAFSEPETAALRDLAKREHIAVHVDFHAYSQLVLYPWNWTAAPAKDRDRLAAIGDRMASAMFAQHEQRYRLMSGVELYPAAGTASDWFYGELGATSYTIELRPTGRPGFVLPPEQIRPTCDEGLAAVLALRAGS